MAANPLRTLGFFFGSTYIYTITDRVAIMFNAAVAVLEGEYDSRGTLVVKEEFPNTDSQPFHNKFEIGYDQKGDTIGLNLGVAWKGQIAESVGYSEGLTDIYL